MTYKGLLDHLQKLGEEALGMDVTIYDADVGEYFPIDDFSTDMDTEGILDENHPVIIIKYGVFD